MGEDSDDDDSSLDGSAEESDLEEDDESLNILVSQLWCLITMYRMLSGAPQ